MSNGRSDVSREAGGTDPKGYGQKNEWLSRVGDQSTTKHPSFAL